LRVETRNSANRCTLAPRTPKRREVEYSSCTTAQRLAFHEAAHCVAQHHLAGGSYLLRMLQARKGETFEGLCYASLLWHGLTKRGAIRYDDSPSAFEREWDNLICHFAGDAAEILMGFHGPITADKWPDITAYFVDWSIPDEETGEGTFDDHERAFNDFHAVRKALFSREDLAELEPYRARLRDEDFLQVAFLDTLYFLEDKIRQISALGSALYMNFLSSSWKRYGALTSAEIESILATPADMALSITEAAVLAEVSPEEMLARVEGGEVAAHLIGGFWRVSKNAVECFT